MEKGLAIAAGEEEKSGELKDVVGEQDRRAALAQLRADRKPPAKREVEGGRSRDETEAGQDRELQAEAENGRQDRRRLPGYREPAKPDKRVEAQSPRLAPQAYVLSRNHDV